MDLAMFGGIVLAAGASTRLGQPKALVPVEGEPAVARVARVLRDAGCKDIRVVTGSDHERIAAAIPSFAHDAFNAHWSKGQTSSVKRGLADLPPASNFIIWPVDRPAVAPSTVAALLGGPGDIRVPAHGGHRGHPTLFAAALRPEILALGDDQPLHDVLHKRTERVVEVPVADPAVHLNVDTSDDLARLNEHLGRIRRARPLA